MADTHEVRNFLYTQATTRWHTTSHMPPNKIRVPSEVNVRKGLRFRTTTPNEFWHEVNKNQKIQHLKGTTYVRVDTTTGEILNFYNIRVTNGISQSWWNKYTCKQMMHGLYVLSTFGAIAVKNMLTPDYPDMGNDYFPVALAKSDDDPDYNLPVTKVNSINGYETYDIIGTVYYLWRDEGRWSISTYPGDYLPGYTWYSAENEMFGKYKCYGGLGTITITRY